MAAQSFLAKLGMRSSTLGSSASLAIAMPLSEGSPDTAAHTAATRIGWYAVQTLGSEVLGMVVGGATGPTYTHVSTIVQVGMSASVAGAAPMNIPQGAAVTSPNNGDFWFTSAGVWAQVNGVTYQLTGTSGGGSITNGQVAYGGTVAGTIVGDAGMTYTSYGQLSLASGVITASSPALNITQTWNSGAVIFTGIGQYITNTASSTSSLLLDMQVGGVSQFKVSVAGVVTASSLTLSQSAANYLEVTSTTNAAGFVANSATGHISSFSWTINSTNIYQIFGSATFWQLYDVANNWNPITYNIGTISAGSIAFAGTLAATAYNTASATFAGGVGVAGALIVQGTVTAHTLTASSGTVVANATPLNVSQTWNNGGVKFIGAVINITNTASDPTSELLSIQNNSSEVMSVNQYGTVTTAGNYATQSGLFIVVGSTGAVTATGVKTPIISTSANLTFTDTTNSTNPLVYTAGAIGAGYWTFANTTNSTTAATGALVIAGGVGIADAKNISFGTTTGTKIGTATTQKLGLWNATPVVQWSTTGTTTGFTANTGTPVLTGTTFTGGVGATAYTLGDVVAALKTMGAMAQ